MPSTQTLPPPPIREPIFTGKQFMGLAMSQVWVNWFTQLFMRAGGGTALTNSEIEVLNNYSDIANGATASEVANLSGQVALNTASIALNTAGLIVQAQDIQELQVLTAFI